MKNTIKIVIFTFLITNLLVIAGFGQIKRDPELSPTEQRAPVSVRERLPKTSKLILERTLNSWAGLTAVSNLEPSRLTGDSDSSDAPQVVAKQNRQAALIPSINAVDLLNKKAIDNVGFDKALRRKYSKNNNESPLTDGPPLDYQNSAGTGDKKTIATAPLANVSNVDFLLRNALYFNQLDTVKVRTDSVYATPAKPLTLTRSQGSACDNQGCEFGLGFFAQRANGRGASTTYAILLGASFGSIGNTVYFPDGVRSKDVVYKVKLKPGANKLTVQIDPNNKTIETDENNNSFEVIINLEN